MSWCGRHGRRSSRGLPVDDQRPKPAPLLTQPFEAAMTGWIVVFGAVLAELAGGAVVANQMSGRNRPSGADNPGRGGIWLCCRAMVAGALVGSRTSELVASDGSSGRRTYLAAVAYRAGTAR